MHEKQAEAQYVRIESNALSQIEILNNEIQSAMSKYDEAVEKKETESVMKAIQRNVDYFKKQINELYGRVETSKKTDN